MKLKWRWQKRCLRFGGHTEFLRNFRFFSNDLKAFCESAHNNLLKNIIESMK